MVGNLLRNAHNISIYFRTFAPMNERQKETLRVRIISVGITCLAFVVFKPIGLEALRLMLYLHFLAIWILGVGVCYVTEGIVTHILGLPSSLDKGVEYIIRRNLWFQLINTPLEALFICVYLHFPMSSIGATDPLSWRESSRLSCFWLSAHSSSGSIGDISSAAATLLSNWKRQGG